MFKWDSTYFSKARVIPIDIIKKMQHCVKIYYSMCKWDSTYFSKARVIHIDITKKMQHGVKIYYSMFKWDSTYFSKARVIHTDIIKKMEHCVKIYYSMFKWGSIYFGRHTAHHQQLKTALAASGFAYMKGCWTLSLLDAVASSNLSVQQAFIYAKPEAANAVLSSWWWAVCRPKYIEPHLIIE
jgi:hypothetical protein